MLHEKMPVAGSGKEDDLTEDRRRGSQRYVTVLKVGRAVVDGQDQLCLVRNMSREGARLDIYHGVTKDQRITVELRSDKVVNGTVRWVGDHAAGIEFDEPVEVGDLLQPKSHRGVLRKLPRAPRFLANANVTLERETGVTKGKLINISLHGLCMESEERVKSEERVIIRIDGLPGRSAAIRWKAENTIGLHFDMPMGFSELARWLETHQPIL
ncbi:MAG: PilZ domain-containing protein [Sphingobium sp.]